MMKGCSERLSHGFIKTKLPPFNASCNPDYFKDQIYFCHVIRGITEKKKITDRNNDIYLDFRPMMTKTNVNINKKGGSC